MKVKIKDIKANPNNPRVIKDEQFKKLVKSIQEFPEMLSVRKLVCTPDMVVLGGNMRLKALQSAGIKEVDVEIVDWDEQKQKEFIIKDNVSFGEWNHEQLANEWDAIELQEWGLELPVNVDVESDQLDNTDDTYTNKTTTPIYDVKNIKPEINDLFNDEKSRQIIQEINKSDISEEEKQFLIYAAYRHLVFNYSKIADFYAHSSSKVQELMEKSALVIIDVEKAIENGFATLSKEMKNLIESEE